MGYHNKEIKRGTFGEFSKIQEEFEELKDGVEQNNPVLIICELCDMLGAIEGFASKWNLTISDLLKMSKSTQSAFKDGTRKSNDINYTTEQIPMGENESHYNGVNSDNLNETISVRSNKWKNKQFKPNFEGDSFTVSEAAAPPHIIGSPTTPMEIGLIKKLKEFEDLDSLFNWLDENHIKVSQHKQTPQTDWDF